MDTGVSCLVAVARFHGVPAEAEQITHEFGVPGTSFNDIDILRAARHIGLKAKLVDAGPGTLDNAVLPAVAQTKDGQYFLIGRVKQAALSDSGSEKQVDQILIHDLRDSAPKVVSLEELTTLWTGKLILLGKDATWGSRFKKHFDISWFFPSLIKYRRIFAEVLVISFFLQLFALITPLFFQVVMDKVLVHRGFTTLNVLAIGFFCVIIFECLLGGIRNYLFSHTTNRVDVELGGRLFHHLLSLPMAYFESRQVGQNVARVRELDSIRNFITGTALTLIIDLSFTFVFLLVMWSYSAPLTWIVIASIPFI